MKTMLDFLNEVSIERGYDGWYQVYSNGIPNYIHLNDIPQKAGKRYAMQYANAKLDEAAEVAQAFLGVNDEPLVSKGSILKLKDQI